MLSLEDQYFLAWYRSLSLVEQFAVDTFHLTGDNRLMLRLNLFHAYTNVFMQVAPSKRIERYMFTSRDFI